jgi:hypothetical protein
VNLDGCARHRKAEMRKGSENIQEEKGSFTQERITG